MWNLDLNRVLEAEVPPGVKVVCYVDDSLVITAGWKWTCTLRIIETVVAAIDTNINYLGLEIISQMMKALWFRCFPRIRRPPTTLLSIQRDRILVKEELMYLGVTLDWCLNFNTHFNGLTSHIKR